ncbi:MAG: hypothetical protein LBK53_08690 [Heliobacteriaceae bacterium]|jgi:hypothetical protein|nr:hypothetical protein [Heliobacteriaceae bacterium]
MKIQHINQNYSQPKQTSFGVYLVVPKYKNADYWEMDKTHPAWISWNDLGNSFRKIGKYTKLMDFSKQLSKMESPSTDKFIWTRDADIVNANMNTRVNIGLDAAKAEKILENILTPGTDEYNTLFLGKTRLGTLREEVRLLEKDVLRLLKEKNFDEAKIVGESVNKLNAEIRKLSKM